MNAICITKTEVSPDCKKGVIGASALISLVSLVVLATLLTLYYCGVYQPPVSAYLLFGPESAGVLLGIITLAIGLCLKIKKKLPSPILNDEIEIDASQSISVKTSTNSPTSFAKPSELGAQYNTPIPLTRLIKGSGTGEMAEKLSAHWLKNAATRIFQNPLRSFLELVVNALDASLPPEKSIGKFGMGFISILTFLDHPETKGGTIQIDTTTKNNDQTLSTYTMDLFKDKDAYQVLFIDQKAQEITGTTITIKPIEASFSDETLHTLLRYCVNLQFYEHGKIELSCGGVTQTIGEGEAVLAWVTLEDGRMIVQDKGCGISKEVARTQLFVPSVSTKHRALLADFTLVVPEFKKYIGKQDTLSHFLISINGAIVIDLPIEGACDLLLKMPPSTRLTLSRDAIEFENRSDTALYLKGVIEATVNKALTSMDGSSLLLALYEGLKKWESQVPSVAAEKLVAHLHATVQKAFHDHPDLIPYPLEYAEDLGPILPDNKKLIPFPSLLLFDHFDSFERLLENDYGNQRSDLINGKTVLFENTNKVSAFGMKKLVFAPLSLLESNPSKKRLQLSLMTQFADEGKVLERISNKKISSQSAFFAHLRGPRQFVFLTGRDTPPTFKGNIILGTQLFKDRNDEPFKECWEKHRDLLHNRMISNEEIFPALLSEEKKFFQLLGYVTREEERVPKQALESLILFDKEGYWVVNDVEAALKFIQKKDQTLPVGDPEGRFYWADRTGKLAALLSQPDFKTQFLTPLSTAEVSKHCFEWLFAQAGVSEKSGTIFTAEEMLWPPPKEITTEYLEQCFHIFLGEEEQLKPVIASRTLPLLQDQEEMWKALESFLDYPGGILAIQKVLPLLLLQEQMLKQDLPASLREKLNICVKQLLSMYHRFLTVKSGEVSAAYGSAPSPLEIHILMALSLSVTWGRL